MTKQSTNPESLDETLARLGVPVIERHIFLCCDQTKPKCCDKQLSLESWKYLKSRLIQLKLTGRGGIYRTKANCLQVCMRGPVALVYPDGPGTGIARPRCWRELFRNI